MAALTHTFNYTYAAAVKYGGSRAQKTTKTAAQKERTVDAPRNVGMIGRKTKAGVGKVNGRDIRRTVKMAYDTDSSSDSTDFDAASLRTNHTSSTVVPRQVTPGVYLGRGFGNLGETSINYDELTVETVLTTVSMVVDSDAGKSDPDTGKDSARVGSPSAFVKPVRVGPHAKLHTQKTTIWAWDECSDGDESEKGTTEVGGKAEVASNADEPAVDDEISRLLAFGAEMDAARAAAEGATNASTGDAIGAPPVNGPPAAEPFHGRGTVMNGGALSLEDPLGMLYLKRRLNQYLDDSDDNQNRVRQRTMERMSKAKVFRGKRTGLGDADLRDAFMSAENKVVSWPSREPCSFDSPPEQRERLRVFFDDYDNKLTAPAMTDAQELIVKPDSPVFSSPIARSTSNGSTSNWGSSDGPWSHR